MYAASLRNYAARLQGKARLLVSEAMPSAVEKADGWYRWQIVLRASSNSVITGAWRWIVAARPAPSSLRVSLDIDALNLV